MDADKEKRFRFQMQLEQEQAQEQPAAPQQMGGSPPLGFVAEQVSAMAPWNKANQMYKDAVGWGAEKLGQNTDIPPAAIGAAMTPLAVAPEILGAYTSLKGIYNSPNPTVKGLVNTPQELSPQYSAQNKVIGVTRRIPQEGGTAPKFEDPYKYPSLLEKAKYAQEESFGPKLVNSSGNPIKSTLPTEPIQGYGPTSIGRPRPQIPAEQLPGTIPTRLPSKPGDFMSYANSKLAQFGNKINPQELMDWQVKIQTDMGNGTIPKIDPSSGRITTIYQQATDLLSRIKGVFNPIAESKLAGATLPKGTIPTRAGLDKAYGVAANLQKATKKVGKVAGGIAGVAALETYIRSKVGR